MKKAASDRKALIRLASALPKGSEERKAVLAGIQKSGGHPLGDRDEVNKTTASLLKDWVAAGVRDWERVVSKFYLNDLSRAHDQIHHFERALGRMRDGITDLYADYVQHSDYEDFYDDLTDSGFYDLETAIEEAEHDLSQMIDKGWADDGYEDDVQQEIEGSILPALEKAMDDFKREYGRPPRVASKKMTSSGAVAKTILDQMGGQRRLQMMIGANKFIDLGKGIGIKWPNKKRSKGNYVEIKLTGDDLYDMTFYNVSLRGKKKVKEHRGLYFDMLVPVFEKQTGWYLRMGSKTAYGNRERGSGGLLFSTKPMFSVKTEPSDPPYNQTYDAMLIASGSGALAVRQLHKTYQQYKREIHAMRSLYEVQKFLDEKVRESGVRGRLRWHHWSMPD